MTIGFDASRAFIQNRTGTENYSFQLLSNLAKIDTQNNYLVYIRPGNIVIPTDWPPNFHFKIIEFKRFWTQAGLSLQTFRDHLDLLFIPSHTLPLVFKPGLKTIITVHDLGAEYLPSMHQLKQRLYLKAMTRYQIKKATKLIAVSKATKKDLVSKVGIDPSKIEVIYEGVGTNLFKPVKNDTLLNVLNKYDLKKENYFLFVGTIQPRKNLNRLIEAYNDLCLKLPDSAIPDLVLAGSKGWLSEDIYALPKKLGIEKQVKFLGRVPDIDLPALYSGALAFTFPSLFEGFGLPILEAMSCGCPVLTSNTSSLPEVAGDAVILVDPNITKDITIGLQKILDKNIRKKLIEKGFKQSQKFSWEICAKKTLEVFQKIALR